MKLLKRLGIFLLVLLVLLIGAAIAIPVVFQDKITSFAKEKINENIDADVDFESVGLSFFRSFPNLNFRLNNFSIEGRDDFDNITLAAGSHFDISVNPFSIFSPPIKIKSVRLDQPVANVYVLEDGSTNYDIFGASSTEESTTTTDYTIDLQSYTINDGAISYTDKTLGLKTTLQGFNHKGKGNFTATIFDLTTTTEIQFASLSYGGIAYLDSATINLDAIINADIENQKYTLKENELLVNDLQLNLDGYTQLNDSDIELNFSFDAPENEFKHLLSLLPNAYTEDFRKVKADGQFLFNGTIDGKYIAETESYPSFVVNLEVSNSDFKYPDLPMGINDINAKVNVRNPGGSLDKTIVDAENFALKVGTDPVEGYLKLSTPLSDPNIDTRIKGNLDLANLVKAYPIEGVKELAGKIIADVTTKAKQSDIENGLYENVNIAGDLTMQDVLYVANGLPNINIRDAYMKFTPAAVNINKFDTRLGKSDVSASGKIYNPLAYLAENQAVKGEMDIRSNYFLVDEWMLESEEAIVASEQPKKDETISDQFDFDLKADFKRIDYSTYELSNLSADANVTANDLKLNNFFTEVNGSDVAASGQAANLYNFIFNGGIMSGAFKLNSNTFDLDKLLATESTTTLTDTTTTAMEVPDYRYDLDVDVNAKNVIYAPYKLSNLVADGNITESTVDITDFKTNIFDSNISGSGNISNYLEYALAGDTVRGDFNLNSTFFNLNSLLASEEYTSNIADTTPEKAQPEDLEAYILPKTWDFKFKGNLAEVLYTDMDILNMTGNITIQDGILLFEDTNGDLLKGKMSVTGGYDTSDPAAPAMNIKMNLEEISFADAFNTFNTFKILAPIGKFIDGKFNTTLLFSSVLGQDMMPDLKTINAEGFLQTFNATIKGFQPLQAIGNQLQTDIFDVVELEDTKNWFTVENGTVKLEEAKFRIKDTDLKVSGTHGLNQEMDYTIEALIPRTDLGSAANKGLNLLESKAKQVGLNLSAGSHVKMRINLAGSLTDPKVGVTPLGAENLTNLSSTSGEGGLDTSLDNIKEEATKGVQTQIEEGKAKADTLINKAIDSTKAVVQQQVDSLKKAAEKKAADAINDKAKEIQDHLEKFNPFKKKKKKEGGD